MSTTTLLPALPPKIHNKSADIPAQTSRTVPPSKPTTSALDDDGPKAYFLEPADPIEELDDDELSYEEVPIEEFDEGEEDEGEETLEKAVRSIHERSFFGGRDILRDVEYRTGVNLMAS